METLSRKVELRVSGLPMTTVVPTARSTNEDPTEVKYLALLHLSVRMKAPRMRGEIKDLQPSPVAFESTLSWMSMTWTAENLHKQWEHVSHFV